MFTLQNILLIRSGTVKTHSLEDVYITKYSINTINIALKKKKITQFTLQNILLIRYVIKKIFLYYLVYITKYSINTSEIVVNLGVSSTFTLQNILLIQFSCKFKISFFIRLHYKIFY